MTQELAVRGWLILLCAPCTTCAQAQVSFPSSSHYAPAPSGEYTVQWLEATTTTPHRLILRNADTGNERALLSFDRHVVVYWNSTGKALAVTDYEGSDEASIWLFQLDKETAPLHLDHTTLPVSTAAGSCQARSHIYVEALGWQDDQHLRIRIRSRDQDERQCPDTVLTFTLP